MAPEVHARLVHSITAYDIKQSKKANYNRYALAQYFAALNNAVALLDKGNTPAYSFSTAFNEPLQSRLIKEVMK